MAITSTKKYCMEMEISEISKLEVNWSPEISIHGIPWKVQVRKMGQDAQQSLGVFLHCDNKDKSPNWSLWGAASFKLLPFSDDGNPIEHHTDPYVFDASVDGHGTGSLIKWNDLFNQVKEYVKDDAINLEVKVTAESPNDPKRSRLNFECIHKCCDNSYDAVFRLKVTNVLNLMAVQSPRFTLRGLTWNMLVSKKRSSHLGVLLKLKEDPGEESCKMTMTIKLVSSKKDVRPIVKCTTKQYQYRKNLSFLEIISWDEIIRPENGFVNDNSITLEIEIDAEKPKDGAKFNPKAEAKFVRLECAVCLESIDGQDLAVTPCGHLFCLECITKVIKDLGVCPTCKTAVQLDTLRQLYLPTVN